MTPELSFAMDSTFSEPGGARLGWLNVTVPFATLSGGRNALRLSCFDQDYVFDRTSIARLSKFRGMFSIGLQILHTLPVYPEFVVIWVSPVPWSSRFAKLKAKLESLGYEVHD
jgi:hypothetical protein